MKAAGGQGKKAHMMKIFYTAVVTAGQHACHTAMHPQPKPRKQRYANQHNVALCVVPTASHTPSTLQLIDKAAALLVLLAAQAGIAVGQVNVELCCTLNNGLALEGGHAVCNLGSVPPANNTDAHMHWVSNA